MKQEAAKKKENEGGWSANAEDSGMHQSTPKRNRSKSVGGVRCVAETGSATHRHAAKCSEKAAECIRMQRERRGQRNALERNRTKRNPE